jgi:dihydrodipicolinate synthase/N-acetylneuraminate lyase
LVTDELHDFEEFAAVPEGNVVSVGAGSLAEDMTQAKKVADSGIDQLWVVVKSWEPPLADLADFLAQFKHVKRCTVYPLSLPGRPVAEEKMEDWRNFSRTLQFSVVDVRALENI